MKTQTLYKTGILTIILAVALSAACTKYWHKYEQAPLATTNLAYIKAALYYEQQKYEEAKNALKPALRQYPHNKDLIQLDKNITNKSNKNTK